MSSRVKVHLDVEENPFPSGGRSGMIQKFMKIDIQGKIRRK